MHVGCRAQNACGFPRTICFEFRVFAERGIWNLEFVAFGFISFRFEVRTWLQVSGSGGSIWLMFDCKGKKPNASHWTGKQHSAGGIADSDGSAPKHGWELMLKHQTLHAVI